MSPKEIAENIVESYQNHGPNFSLDFEDAAKIARAYLELEKKLQVTNSNWPHEKQLHEEITKLKEENEKLKLQNKQLTNLNL